MSGVVEIGKSGTRYSSFYMNALTKNGDSEAVSVVFVKGDNTVSLFLIVFPSLFLVDTNAAFVNIKK